MRTSVAINGFGRVGRAAFRAAYERGAGIDWVAINDLADADTLAYLLRHDSVYGPFPGTVEARSDAIVVDGDAIPVLNESDPARLPWRSLGADVVLEATGRFRARADAGRHLEAGALKVVISAPAKAPDATVVLGVNFDSLRPRGALDRLQRVMHHELPRTGREGPPRGARDRARRDDHDPRVHRRPAARRPAAQGSPASARRGDQHRPDVDRGREGDRARDPGARRAAARLRRAGSRADRLARRPDGGRRPHHERGGGQRGVRRTSGSRGARGHPRLQRGAARLDRCDQVAVLGDLRRRAHDRERRNAGEGRRVVRQRVGVLDAARRAPPARARAR